jgi:CheY-like chemotaxis protein
MSAETIESLHNFNPGDKRKTQTAKISRPDLSHTRVLVVDDFVINIDVAKGMLSKYKMQVDYVTNGQDAIDLIKSGEPVYNAIFMDHMMPGMDGIEATSLIRAVGTDYARKMPVIALTANATVGNEEMFLNSGFQAFLSKPINVVKLDEVIKRWIANIPVPETPNFAAHMQELLAEKGITDINVASGLERYDNDEVTYLKVMRSFMVSIPAVLEALENVSSDNLPDYKIKVHGIKGACFDISAGETGNTAFELEKAAGRGDIDFVTKHNQPFLETMRGLISGIEHALGALETENPKPLKDKPDSEALSKLRAACEFFNFSGANAIMTEIDKYQYKEKEDDELVKWLRDNLSGMNFAQIAERLGGK